VNINWNPDNPDNYDPYKAASNPKLEWKRMFSFDDYLATIVSFWENALEKHTQYISDLYWEVESGKTEMQGELDYALFEENKFPEFENDSFSSFFIMIYSYMESELLWYCRDLEKRNPQSVLLSDLAGGNSVEKFMTYLIKVQHIEFSKEESPEWAKVKDFTLLRNCIVHNQGRVDDSFSKKKELLKFIQRQDSKLKLEDTTCILDKNFCSYALGIIKRFLDSVAAAKKPKVPRENASLK